MVTFYGVVAGSTPKSLISVTEWMHGGSLRAALHALQATLQARCRAQGICNIEIRVGEEACMSNKEGDVVGVGAATAVVRAVGAHRRAGGTRRRVPARTQRGAFRPEG